MNAIRTLLSEGRRHTYSGIVRDVPYGAHAVRLDSPGDFVFVVWNDDPALCLRIEWPADSPVSFKDMFGDPLVLARDELVLNESMGPVYVHWKRR